MADVIRLRDTVDRAKAGAAVQEALALVDEAFDVLRTLAELARRYMAVSDLTALDRESVQAAHDLRELIVAVEEDMETNQ